MREPVVAGSFYPKRSEDCLATVNSLLNEYQTTRKDPTIQALVSPHAGYMYSGSVAAKAISALSTSFSTVVIISPSHRFTCPFISIYKGDGYRTPLGDIPLNKTLSDKLRNSSPLFNFEPRCHELEHGIETQLPFLQAALPHPFSLVSIVMGSQSLDHIQALTDTLIQNYSEDTLYIASSDFSHFFTAEQALGMDYKALGLIANQSYMDLFKAQEDEQVQLCGLGPVITVGCVMAEKTTKTPTVLTYKHSGEVTGDNSSVVGYSAITFSEGSR